MSVGCFCSLASGDVTRGRQLTQAPSLSSGSLGSYGPLPLIVSRRRSRFTSRPSAAQRVSRVQEMVSSSDAAAQARVRHHQSVRRVRCLPPISGPWLTWVVAIRVAICPRAMRLPPCRSSRRDHSLVCSESERAGEVICRPISVGRWPRSQVGARHIHSERLLRAG